MKTGTREPEEDAVAEEEKSKPVVRAEHMKLIKAKRVKLDKLIEQTAAAREEFNQAIRDAFAAGLVVTPISEAAGISKDRAWQIKHNRR